MKTKFPFGLTPAKWTSSVERRLSELEHRVAQLETDADCLLDSLGSPVAALETKQQVPPGVCDNCRTYESECLCYQREEREAAELADLSAVKALCDAVAIVSALAREKQNTRFYEWLAEAWQASYDQISRAIKEVYK
jgi:hypothetical protein